MMDDEEMKKLFLFVLCLFFVAGSAQAGAGGNSAKQDEQLRQAGPYGKVWNEKRRPI